jgi:hypothetical protein
VSADARIKFSDATAAAIGLEHYSQRFSDPLFASDDFDKNTAIVNAAYQALPFTGFLVEYSYQHVDNKNPSVFPDMDTHSFLAGTEWRAGARLTGYLKVGYYLTSLDNGEQSRGFDTDTDVEYAASDFIKIEASAFRSPVRSIRAARETGDFYISTGGSLAASYTGWDPITAKLDLLFTNKRFYGAITEGGERTDDFLACGLLFRYSFRQLLIFSLGYRYGVNDSTSVFSYRENRFEAGMLAAI